MPVFIDQSGSAAGTPLAAGALNTGVVAQGHLISGGLPPEHTTGTVDALTGSLTITQPQTEALVVGNGGPAYVLAPAQSVNLSLGLDNYVDLGLRAAGATWTGTYTVSAVASAAAAPAQGSGTLRLYRVSVASDGTVGAVTQLAPSGPVGPDMVSADPVEAQSDDAVGAGSSLVTNLNRIRYSLAQAQGPGGSWTGGGANLQDVGALYGTFPNANTGHAIRQVGSVPILAPGAKMALVRGRYLLVPGLYAWYVVDVSDPTAPVILATRSNNTASNAICAQGDYVFVAAAAGLDIYTLDTPSNPVHLGTNDNEPHGTDVVASGSYALMSTAGWNYVELLNVTEPQGAGIIFGIPNGRTLSDASYIALTGDGQYALVTQPKENAIAVCPLSPFDLGESSMSVTSGLAAPNGIVCVGSYAYAAQGNGTLATLNVVSPQAPILVGTTPLVGNSTPAQVTAAGGYLYVSGAGVVSVLSIKNAATPVLIATISVGEASVATSGLCVWDRYLGVLDQTNNLLRIFDLSSVDVAAATVGTAGIGRLVVHEGVDVRGGVQADRLDVGLGGALVSGDLALTGQVKGSLVGTTPIGVRCSNSSGVLIPNNLTTALTFDTVRFDKPVLTPHHDPATPSRLTCQVDGLYQISATVWFLDNATGVRRLAIMMDGDWYIDMVQIGPSTVAAQDYNGPLLSLSTVWPLSPGHYVEAVVFQNSGVSLDSLSMASGSIPNFGMVRIA